RRRIVRTRIGIVRFVAVGSPKPLEGASLGVKHDHALVQIAVGDVNLMSVGIDVDTGRTAKDIGARAVRRISGREADLHDELAIALELENLAIGGAVSADPNVVVLVDVNSMLDLGPIVAFPGTSPGLQQISLWVEDEYRRRVHTTHGARRCL